jgi:hypothetical protein
MCSASGENPTGSDSWPRQQTSTNSSSLYLRRLRITIALIPRITNMTAEKPRRTAGQVPLLHSWEQNSSHVLLPLVVCG